MSIDKTAPADHLIVAGTTTIHDVLRMNTAEFEKFLVEHGDDVPASFIQELDGMRRDFAALPKDKKDKQDAALAPGALDPNGIYAARLAKKTAAHKAVGNENRPLDHAAIYAARAGRGA